MRLSPGCRKAVVTPLAPRADALGKINCLHPLLKPSIADLAQETARLAKVDPEEVHVDVPTTTSMPYTSSREALTSLTLIAKTVEGKKVRMVLVQDLPLIGAITGFFNIMRNYTAPEHRVVVEKVVSDFFGCEGFMTKISV